MVLQIDLMTANHFLGNIFLVHDYGERTVADSCLSFFITDEIDIQYSSKGFVAIQ